MHPELPPLIQDLGLILIAAAVMTLLFKWLRQPLILGYLIAGFIVSEFFPTPWMIQHLPEFVQSILQVQDTHSIHIWSEIGVIFMLFGLGLEFSFKRLLAVGRIATVTGGFEVISTTILGFFIGRLLGWNNMDSIFFGAMLAMSSTTIILKVFDELKLKARAFAPIVFGALIVEDLLAMLLLVLLSSIAITQQFAGGELFFASMKLSFFLILWFIMGIFLLPWFLKLCRKILIDEILLLVSVGLCFLMVIIACNAGFSSALGAFVMGSILAETSRGTKIEHLMQPIKDLFSAVFFVSVGMMINPYILWDYAGTVAFITFITVFVKFFGTGIGALLAGCNLRNSMQAGMSMAQIGEFSFIIATLGKSLGVISDFLYPVAVATSAVTTLTTPYLIKSSDTLAKWLHTFVPDRVHHLLTRYESAMNTRPGKDPVLLLLWKVHGLAILLNAVVIIGIVWGGSFLIGWVNPSVGPTVYCATLLLASPFFWGIFRNRLRLPESYDTETTQRLQQLQIGVSFIRFFLGLTFLEVLIFVFLPTPYTIGLAVVIGYIAFLFLLGRFFEILYQRFEAIFVSNLSEKERSVVEERSALSHLLPWEATLTEFMLSEYSPLVLQTLQGSNLKRDYGVTIAIIKRGNRNIVAPKSDEILLPCDRLYLIGTYEQLAIVQEIIEYQQSEESQFDDDNFGMVSLRLHKGHAFVGRMILDCGVRESANGLIVGIERNGQRFLNPSPSMTLESGDIIWLVGEHNKLRSIN